MPLRYLNRLPGPPDLINHYPGETPADKIYARWVTPYDPQEKNAPAPPILELYQSHLAQPVDDENHPEPEPDPDPDQDQNPEQDPEELYWPGPGYQPALEHLKKRLLEQNWTLVQEDSGKDFVHCFLAQPADNAWQPTQKLFAQLSGYNKEGLDIPDLTFR